MAASLRFKSSEDNSLLKSYNGGIWKNIYRSGPYLQGRAVDHELRTNSHVAFNSSINRFPVSFLQVEVRHFDGFRHHI